MLSELAADADDPVDHGFWDVAAVFPLAAALGFTHLPCLCWPILLLTLLAYLCLTQIIKVWLLRRKWS
jgi:hypothetical protein